MQSSCAESPLRFIARQWALPFLHSLLFLSHARNIHLGEETGHEGNVENVKASTTQTGFSLRMLEVLIQCSIAD